MMESKRRVEANDILLYYGDQAPNIPIPEGRHAGYYIDGEPVSNGDGGRTTFPVPSGAYIDIHVPGLRHNRTLSTIPCIIMMGIDSHEAS